VQLNTFYSYSAGQQFLVASFQSRFPSRLFINSVLLNENPLRKKQTKGLICKASFKADNKKPINIKLPRFVARQTFFVLSLTRSWQVNCPELGQITL
jgi:hypothetical protein